MTARLTAEVIEAMTDAEYKVAEDRMRRMAKRQGLFLQKSRRRDPRATDYCTYALTDGYALVAGPGVSLDAIESILLGDGETERRGARNHENA